MSSNSNMASSTQESPEDVAARLLEFGLVRNFECTARFHIPEPFVGCCGPFMDNYSNARSERLRQEYLARHHKTDAMVEENILLALRKCPCLAKQKYKNFAGQDVYPFWYFVLSGSDQDKVEEVLRMYPDAIKEPIREDITVKGTEKYSLLEAACSSSKTTDDVLVFLANKSPPEFLSTSFQFEPLPFVSRAIDRPRRNEDAPLAPLDLVKALAPLGGWSLDWFNELFGLGYSADVLQYAADRVQNDNINNKHTGDILSLAGPFGRPKCLLDKQRAAVVEGLLRSQSLVLREFHCVPRTWTRAGLHHLLHCFEVFPATLSLKIESEMFVSGKDDDEVAGSDLVAVKHFFSRNQTIHSLSLEVEKPYLEAIAKGLAHKSALHPNLALTLMADSQQEEVDVTDILLQIFNQGFLQRLCIRGSYRVDISRVCSSLLSDTTLQSFEMDLVLPVPTTKHEHEQSPLDAVLELLRSNAVLEQVMLYDKKRAVDYTGFTKCPRGIIKPVQRFYKPRIFDERLGDQMLYYMMLNQCGRQKARMVGTGKEDFIGILEAVKEKQWGSFGRPATSSTSDAIGTPTSNRGVRSSMKSDHDVDSSDIYYFNMVFGLLIESSPSLWSPRSE